MEPAGSAGRLAFLSPGCRAGGVDRSTCLCLAPSRCSRLGLPPYLLCLCLAPLPRARVWPAQPAGHCLLSIAVVAARLALGWPP
jgi:hypothetical protein